jgi:hypothetical protein
LKIHPRHSGANTGYDFSQLTQKHTSQRKQWEEEDFPYPTLFWRFNLQAFQALKEKSNPKQVI